MCKVIKAISGYIIPIVSYYYIFRGGYMNCAAATFITHYALRITHSKEEVS